MQQKTLAALDKVSAALLLAWPLLALAHFLFKRAITIPLVDMAAWAAFGSALALTWLPRWLNDVADREAIGPFRLWAAACMVALILCMASSFVANPKMAAIEALLASPGSPAQQRDALKRAHAKAHSFSVQFLCIRAALAITLAFGAKKLPSGKTTLEGVQSQMD